MFKSFLKIITFTYPFSIVFLIFKNFLKKKIFADKNVKYYVIFFSFIYLINFFRSLFYEFNLINILSESKVFILIIVLSSTKEILTNKQTFGSYIKSFIYFSYFLLFISVISTGNIIRYADNVSLFTHYLSIYLGVSLSLMLIFSKTKFFNHGLFLILLNASGTGILSMLVVIFYRFRKVKKSLIKLLFAILICLIFLLYGQNQRGRSFDLIQNIDRVVLLDASFKQIKNSSISELLIGNYLSYDTNIDEKITYEPIKEYILAENNGKVYPRQTHNEHIRLILQFGILGWMLVWLIIYKSFKLKSEAVFWALFVSGFSNMVLSITPIIFVLYIIKKYAKKN